MIELITGKLIEKFLTDVIVDANGVGYGIRITISTYEKLGDIGSIVSIPVHLNVKEDLMQLFGFIDSTEKEIFRLLVGVSGVGPKTALGMLSGATGSGICELLVNGDVKGLSRLPGIGKKSAELLILKLKDKALGYISNDIGSKDSPKRSSTKVDEAVSALVALGYKELNARKALAKVEEDLAVEEMIKEAFKHIL